jgi:NADPH-dependent curcumin reductase CurA
MRSRELTLVRHPQEHVSADCFAIVDRDLEAIEDGQVLVRNLWTSVDASVLLRLRQFGTEGYLPPFALGEPLAGLAVGEVCESRCPEFAAGDLVVHIYGFRDYALVRPGGATLAGVGALRRIRRDLGAPEDYLGALGHTGVTAYVGLMAVAELTAGDVVWVSAAAGATGSVAAQIAKLRGHLVIGSAGSNDKVDYLLNELKLDAAFNYKDGELRALLRASAPGGIDVYYDNVGGYHLEAALYELRNNGRVAMCGAVSGYDGTPGLGPRNMFQAVVKNLTLRGFRAGAHASLEGEALRTIGAWMREGRLKVRTTIYEGLARAPDAIVGLARGANIGKTLVRSNVAG